MPIRRCRLAAIASVDSFRVGPGLRQGFQRPSAIISSEAHKKLRRDPSLERQSCPQTPLHSQGKGPQSKPSAGRMVSTRGWSEANVAGLVYAQKNGMVDFALEKQRMKYLLPQHVHALNDLHYSVGKQRQLLLDATASLAKITHSMR